MSFEKKLVAIVNEKIEVGIAMNALAHASLALGAKLGEKECFLTHAKQENILQIAFTDTMTLCASYEEQIFNTAQKTVDEFVYYAGVLYGDFEKVKTITKRFSLFR